ncbi:MAG: CoA-acylating methylmalonate-semialdehyde dehydrogenase [Acidobacteria bacterium]|nr:CoA-acylating methylmalonate-semialdehyde dehydrogenase [Acidobacteriota bacterium]
MKNRQLMNYINGQWRRSSAGSYLDVTNPATAEVLAQVPLSTPADVELAVKHATAAFQSWRRTPATQRIQYLFKLKNLLEQNIQELACLVTNECGKTREESLGELRRGIETVEVACGIPSLMQGYNNEDIASGIDEHLYRQPVGVVAAITPFNFPGMIPLWFLPFAIACGNCFILKPSERVPLTSVRLMELLEQTGLPPGVVQLVHGDKETVIAILDHPGIRAISFVGSTPVAKFVYARATANGKRAQCQGGAKNPAIVLPDADPEFVTKTLAESAFGCAGQRCLASSVALTVGEAGRAFTDAMIEEAASRRVGYGLEEGIQMGPVITSQSKERINKLVALGEREGAKVLLDGRDRVVKEHPEGYFLFPTILGKVDPRSEIACTEIFGPVLSLMHVATLEDAIAEVNRISYGNMACLFTRSGAAARKFRYEANAGNIGINVGVAAPMAFFPFSGWNESFFGDLHAQGMHAVEFYTEAKVVVERWP